LRVDVRSRKVEEIAAAAGHTGASPHNRERFGDRPARVREALDPLPVVDGAP